jgi:hemolysin III
MAVASAGALPRPLLRGWIHLGSALIAPFALLWLILEADSPRAYVGAAVFGSSLIVLFATSAALHLVNWRPRAHAFVRKMDHSSIFVAVAGAYTPFCLQVLGAGWGLSVLSVVGGLALAGVLMKQSWPNAPRWLEVSLYLFVGWVALVAAPVMVSGLPAWAFLMVLGSGVLYSIGALCFAFRWPNPAPNVFGFHEVFHASVTLASAMLFVVVLWDVLPR